MASGPARFLARAMLAAGLVLAPARTAQAQRITRSDYAIDVYTGLVLSSGRQLGMGGAFTAMATGIDGVPWNPASYAARTLWELRWFEWDLTGGLVFPGAFNGDDLENRGDNSFRYDNLTFLSAGLRLQFGAAGAGVLLRMQSFGVSLGAQHANVQLLTGQFGGGYSILDGQLVFGLGLRTSDFTITQSDRTSLRSTDLVRFTGSAPELGALLAPADQPWRIGAAVRLEVSSRATDLSGALNPAAGVYQVGTYILPSHVHMPWEVQLGFAYQLGSRPLNRRWVNPHDERRRIEEQVRASRRVPVPSSADLEEEEKLVRERLLSATLERYRAVRALTRRYLLLSLDCLVTGPTATGNSLEGFLSQQYLQAGRAVSVSVRLGAEGEPWPNRLKLRLGTYYEPGRFVDRGGRMHVTSGVELRLFDWSLFGLLSPFSVRVSAAVDLAERYFDWGIGVGIWH